MHVISYIYDISLHMINYISEQQLKFKEFGNLYQMKLNPKNRWVQLAEHFPWDKCVKIFTRHFPDTGRSSIDPRIVIGSLIIKHKLCLSDEETARIIEENPYMQYFWASMNLRPPHSFLLPFLSIGARNSATILSTGFQMCYTKSLTEIKMGKAQGTPLKTRAT